MEAARELKRWLRAALTDSPFSGKTYLVGGCVRDELLGLSSKDLDVVVEQAGGAEALCRFLHDLSPEKISQPHNLGAGYPIWQLVFPEDLEWRGEIFRVAGLDLEVADTQREMFPDPQSRKRIAVYGNLEEDCLRRDFTCNMLYENGVTGEVLDPSGRGLRDLRAGLLAGHPAADMVKIFSDDPLRIVRLLRFECRFGWPVEERVLSAVQATKDRLKILSAERVRDEWMKVIDYGKQADFFRRLADRGLLAELFPELLPMLGCRQDRIYHSEGDVWTHTMLVVEKAPPELVLQLAALLHDVGKPATRSEDGERVKFFEHERISEKISDAFLRKWKFSDSVVKKVNHLIALHLRGGDVMKWQSLKPARKLLREAGDDLTDLLKLIEADSSSSLGPDGKARLEHIPLLKQKLEEASRIPIATKALLDGHTIMRLLSVPAGPEIKEAQNLLKEFEDEEAEQGRHPEAEAAARWLKARWRK